MNHKTPSQPITTFDHKAWLQRALRELVAQGVLDATVADDLVAAALLDPNRTALPTDPDRAHRTERLVLTLWRCLTAGDGERYPDMKLEAIERARRQLVYAGNTLDLLDEIRELHNMPIAQGRLLPEPEPGAPCQHEAFDSRAMVARIIDIGAFMVELRVSCRDCGSPFRFLGLPGGCNLQGAALSFDGLEARLAIAPGSLMPAPPDDAPVCAPAGELAADSTGGES